MAQCAACDRTDLYWIRKQGRWVLAEVASAMTHEHRHAPSHGRPLASD